MSAIGAKQTNSIAVLMSANDPKADTRSRRLVSLKCLPQSRAGMHRVRRNFLGWRRSQGHLAGTLNAPVSDCPIRHTMPRPL